MGCTFGYDGGIKAYTQNLYGETSWKDRGVYGEVTSIAMFVDG